MPKARDPPAALRAMAVLGRPGIAHRRIIGRDCELSVRTRPHPMKLIPEIQAAQPEIQALRRDIHAHPELCFEEQRTSDLVAAKLTEWGIEVHRGLGKTGLVGVIRNGAL